MAEFERHYTRYGLLADNKWVICILPDEKLTEHEQKEVIAITGTELVKVHVRETYEMLEIVKEMETTPTGIDEKTIKRPGAFRGMKPEKLNKPIDIEYTANVQTLFTAEVSTIIYLSKKDGKPYDMPENLTSAEKATIAKLMGARLVVARFYMRREFLPKASPHRSQAKV